jgi:hypothetical protein
MDDRPEIGRMDLVLLQPVAGADLGSGTGPQAPRDARHFEGMREPRADVVVIREREDLGFILQSPESGAEDDSVTVPLKIRTSPLAATRRRPAEPIRAEQFWPAHPAGTQRRTAAAPSPDEKSGPNGSGVSGSGVTVQE